MDAKNGGPTDVVALIYAGLVLSHFANKDATDAVILYEDLAKDPR